MSVPTFHIYFDGGGSGEYAYGSWEVEFMGFLYGNRRLRFPATLGGVRTTSNCAEYLALLCALDWLQSVKEPRNYAVKVSGDSKLVINQVNRFWKCKLPHLQMLRLQVWNRLENFAWFDCEWKPRQHSVARFGH